MYIIQISPWKLPGVGDDLPHFETTHIIHLYSFLAGQDSIPETCQIFEERKSAQIFEVIKLAPALHTYLQGGVENM